MTQFASPGLPPGADDGTNLGHLERPASDQAFVGRTSAAASGRALVPTTLPREFAAHESVATSQRPRAAFVAQLIATALKAPQTRARRRAEPADASAVYATVAAGCSATSGTLSRSL
jgi:hypothetical protein